MGLNLFIKKTLLKKNKVKYIFNYPQIPIKPSLVLYNVHFYFINNNVRVSVFLKNPNRLVFWRSSKFYKKTRSRGGILFRAYHKQIIVFLCESLVFFFQKTFKQIKTPVFFYFRGLNKYKLFVIRFFKQRKLKIQRIFELSFLPHNGVRSPKKKRLAKKKRRKLYHFVEFKRFKKKKNIVKVTLKASNSFLLKDLLLKIFIFFHFKLSSNFFYSYKTVRLSPLRPAVVFSKHRRCFFIKFELAYFRIFFKQSSSFRAFILSYFSKTPILKFSGLIKIKNHSRSYCF